MLCDQFNVSSLQLTFHSILNNFLIRHVLTTVVKKLQTVHLSCLRLIIRTKLAKNIDRAGVRVCPLLFSFARHDGGAIAV